MINDDHSSTIEVEEGVKVGFLVGKVPGSAASEYAMGLELSAIEGARASPAM